MSTICNYFYNLDGSLYIILKASLTIENMYLQNQKKNAKLLPNYQCTRLYKPRLYNKLHLFEDTLRLIDKKITFWLMFFFNVSCTFSGNDLYIAHVYFIQNRYILYRLRKRFFFDDLVFGQSS